MTDLAVVNVECGKRYRLRLVAMSCHANFVFSIDNHDLTIIEADGQETEPLVVDSIQMFAGQRYSVILNANQPADNYWMRSLPDINNATFNGGQNSAILRYKGASVADPSTEQTNSTMPFVENNLHALVNPGAPGIPGYGMADINLRMMVNLTEGGVYLINGVEYKSPTVPVLLQILSGAQQATDLLPTGSVYVLEANKVVELTLVIGNESSPVTFMHIRIPCYMHLMNSA